MRAIRSLGIGLALPLLALGGLTQPAQATPAPRIGLTVSSATPPIGEPVTFSGKVSGKLKRDHVALQQLRSGSWTTVGGDTLSSGSYLIRLASSPGTTTFRVKGLLAATGHVLKSRSVTITSEPAEPTLAQVQARILKDTNDFRASYGLVPLVMDADISTVAQTWTQDMADHDALVHNPQYAEQIPSGWTRAGENIAYGYAYTTVEDAWEASPGHRANMLSDYTRIGIGYAVAADGTPYFTQDFGTY